MHIIDPSFLKRPKNYIIQSLLAILVVAVILYFVEVLTHAAIVAALGASTFIVFAMPGSITARPRRLIGGHAVGLASGAFCRFVVLDLLLRQPATKWAFITWCVCALAVGLSIFLMTITNTEHPPASATALGVVAHGWSYQTAIFILACAIILAVIRRLFRRYLKDLF
jgi:CBS-domain-containing membrane protein